MDPILIPIGIGLYLLFGKKKGEEEGLTIMDEDVYLMPDADVGPSNGQPGTIIVTPPPAQPPVVVLPPYVPPSPINPVPAPPPPPPPPVPAPYVPPYTPPLPPSLPGGSMTSPPVGEYAWGAVYRAQAWVNQRAQFAPHEQIYILTKYGEPAVTVKFPNDSWKIAPKNGWSIDDHAINYNAGSPSVDGFGDLGAMLGMWEN